MRGCENLESNKFQTFCDCFYGAFQKMINSLSGIEISLNPEVRNISGKTLSAIVGVVGLNKGRVHLEMDKSIADKLY
jgi:CheY-specific phosphatase CheX